ncbi:MAG: hypothetical protein AABZ26_00415 [Chloroflexota bacterium]
MTKQLQIIALAVAGLALAGGGFVAGTTAAQTRASGEAASAAPSPGAGGAQGRRLVPGASGAAGPAGGAQGQQVAGRVISVGADAITIELRQPGGETSRSVIALVGSSTRLLRTSETEITLADIKAGDQVIVVGTPDQTTGTVSANAIVVGISALQQLFGGGASPGPGGRRGASPSPSSRSR